MDARIQKIFRDVLGDSTLEVNEELSPSNTTAWDSFATAKLMLALEEAYRVTFTMDEIAEVTKAGDFVKALKTRGVKVE